MSNNNTLPLTVGLTGGIGSGKSIVSELFVELGVPVIDTDQLSRELVRQGSPQLNEIADYFGAEILLESGDLNRRMLRQIIFDNSEKKQWLEQLLHPKIKESLLEQLANYNDSYVIIVVPLLLEGANYDFIDRVLVVDCSEELQLKRASIRDQSKVAEIKKIIDSQIPRKQRLSLADDIIVNDESEESLKEKVLKLHEKYRQLGSK